MTQEEHNLLVENNIMLKQIIAYIRTRADPNDLNNFAMNILANIVSNQIK